MRYYKFLLILLISLLSAGCVSETNTGIEKVYISFGDSITWQDKHKYPNAILKKATGYQSILEDELGYSTVNKGIDGGSMAKSSSYPESGSILLDNTYKEIKSSNLVTVLAGTNDFKLNVPLGDLNKKSDIFDDTTFIGAYQKLIEKVKKENQSAKIYLFTPLQRDNDGYDIHNKNKAGYKLIDYVNAVKELGEYYDIPVRDLYNESEINENTLNKYTRDGLHPNEEGYEILASEMISFIKE